MVAHAEDNKYPIKIPHIFTKEQWEHSTAPPPMPIFLKPDYSKYPKLSLEEQKMVENAINTHSTGMIFFWINIKGLNSSNILEFGKNIKYIDNNFVSKIDGKIIKIPTKEIFVKRYDYFHKGHPLHDCPHMKKEDDKYGSYCDYVTLQQDGYQKYIVPKKFSLSLKINNIALFMTDNNAKILNDKKTIELYPYNIKPSIDIIYPKKIDDNIIKNWFTNNKIHFTYEQYSYIANCYLLEINNNKWYSHLSKITGILHD